MPDVVIGMTAGNYRIVSKLSAGGMGTVYRAEHVMIGQQVAIKVLQPELSHNREVVARFFDEAKATSSIKHPGIVVVIDFGYLESGLAYIVMELLEGMTLARRIKRRGVLPEREAVALLRDVCGGLGAAHDKGIIHRDLKPDNLFLIEDSIDGERIKILDFGIAKLTDTGSSHEATKTGAVMGTPKYMSPEQCRGSGDVDVRADIYSLGCIFYQMLTGKPPFTVEGAGEVIGMQLYVQPEPPSRQQSGISTDIEALVMAMLEKDPAARPQTTRDLEQALAAISTVHGWEPSARARWSLAGAAYAKVATQTYSPSDLTSAPSVSPPTRLERPPTARASQPTTLSGAASQVAAAPKKKKSALIAVAAVVSLVGVGAGFSVFKTGSTTLAKSPASSPIVTVPIVTAPPKVVTAVPVPVEKKVEPPPQVIETKTKKPLDPQPGVPGKTPKKKTDREDPIVKPLPLPLPTKPPETKPAQSDKQHDNAAPLIETDVE